MGEGGKHGGCAWEVEGLGFSGVKAFSADRLRPAKPYFSARSVLVASYREEISLSPAVIASQQRQYLVPALRFRDPEHRFRNPEHSFRAPEMSFRDPENWFRKPEH